MSAAANGAPVFPGTIEPGISLRDYFAIKALAIRPPGNYPYSYMQLAQMAYATADAMLAARQS
jgi:hypothetical protein